MSEVSYNSSGLPPLEERIAEIKRALSVYHKNGDVVEMRVPKDRGAGSGYYDQWSNLAQDAALLTESSRGVYITMNQVNPDLLSRRANRYIPNAKTTTGDQDIVSIRWLLIDLDPVRPSGISSTDEEHEAALAKARKIRDSLHEGGWPAGAFVLADSGNGAHLSVRLQELESTTENVNLIKQCLESLKIIFSDKAVEVDTTTSNPSRLWKLPGTMARKGDNTPERPHRMARILEEPGDSEAVTREMLEELSELAPNPLAKKMQFHTWGPQFDPVEYAKRNGVNVTRTKKWTDSKGTSWNLAVLEVCPFNPEHKNGSAMIGVAVDSGARHFRCFHNSCKKNRWKDLEKLWGDPEDTSNAPEPKPETKDPEPVDPVIQQKAEAVLKNGDPIKYVVDSCGRTILGSEKALRKLACCVAVQDVRQSAGLHPKLNGESGGGKTAVLLTFAHHLPSDAVVKGSMSNMSPFYHEDGNRILRILDDYRAGNEGLDTVIKQTSSVFHETYTHKTVINQKAVTLMIGSEQTWAITSVDSSQDIQVLNRQLPINIDDSEELTRQVNARTIERYGRGQEQYPVDETVQVSREMFRILRSDGYINVRVPYYERIEWLDTSNRRNTSIFMDLLVAYTAMFRHQRERDEDGCYLATVEDFEAARALFIEKDAEELVHRLTQKEREFANLLRKNPAGLTRNEVAQELGVSVSRVSQLANGEGGKGGLSQKLPGFEATEVTESVELRSGSRRSERRTIYRLADYDPLTGFDAVVRLLPEPVPPEPVSAGGSEGSEDGVRVGVRFSKNDETDNREIDREIEIDDSKDSEDLPRESPVIKYYNKIGDTNVFLPPCKISSLPNSKATDIENGHLPGPNPPFTAASGSGGDSSPALAAELAEADRRQAEHEEHFKTPGPAGNSDRDGFLNENVGFVLAARDLGQFTSQTLAGKTGAALGDALRFLQAARMHELVTVTEPGNRRDDGRDLWLWTEMNRLACRRGEAAT